MAATSLSSRPHASVYNVPAFASGLGMTLEPIKTAAAAAGVAATNATTTAVTLEKVSKREIFQDLLPSFASLLSHCLSRYLDGKKICTFEFDIFLAKCILLKHYENGDKNFFS